MDAWQIWTNFFAGLIALGSALVTNVAGTFLPNVELLLTSPALLWDVSVFSSASSFGLIILLNTIASFVCHVSCAASRRWAGRDADTFSRVRRGR